MNSNSVHSEFQGDIPTEVILTTVKFEYHIGPILLKFEYEEGAKEVTGTAYYAGVKIGTVTLSTVNTDLCIEGKVNGNNKVKVCFTAKVENDTIREISLNAQVCLFGICKSWSAGVSLPTFKTIDDF